MPLTLPAMRIFFVLFLYLSFSHFLLRENWAHLQANPISVCDTWALIHYEKMRYIQPHINRTIEHGFQHHVVFPVPCTGYLGHIKVEKVIAHVTAALPAGHMPPTYRLFSPEEQDTEPSSRDQTLDTVPCKTLTDDSGAENPSEKWNSAEVNFFYCKNNNNSILSSVFVVILPKQKKFYIIYT